MFWVEHQNVKIKRIFFAIIIFTCILLFWKMKYNHDCSVLFTFSRPDGSWVLCRGSRMRQLWIALDSTLEKRQHWSLLVQCLRFVRQDERNYKTAPETTATTCKQASPALLCPNSLTVSANVFMLLKYVMHWHDLKSIIIRYMCYVFNTCCAQCTCVYM